MKAIIQDWARRRIRAARQVAHAVLRMPYMVLLSGAELISSVPDAIFMKAGYLLRGCIAGFDGFLVQKRNIVVVAIKILWFSAMTPAAFPCKIKSSYSARAGAIAAQSTNKEERKR